MAVARRRPRPCAHRGDVPRAGRRRRRRRRDHPRPAGRRRTPRRPGRERAGVDGCHGRRARRRPGVPQDARAASTSRATSARASSVASAGGWTRSAWTRTPTYLDYSRSSPTSSSRSSTRSSSTSPRSSATPTRGSTSREEVLPRLLGGQGRRQPDPRLVARAARRARRPYTSRCCWPRRSARRRTGERVKIYATDVDEEALDAGAPARRTRPRRWRACPTTLRDRYFERTGERFAFRKDLRRSVIFGRNDLVQDAPISRVDLLCAATRSCTSPPRRRRDPAPLPLRAAAGGLPVPRQVGDAAHARASCSSRSTSSAASSRKVVPAADRMGERAAVAARRRRPARRRSPPRRCTASFDAAPVRADRRRPRRHAHHGQPPARASSCSVDAADIGPAAARTWRCRTARPSCAPGSTPRSSDGEAVRQAPVTLTRRRGEQRTLRGLDRAAAGRAASRSPRA